VARDPAAPLAPLAPVVATDAAHRGGLGVGAFLLALATAGAMAHVAVRMKGIEVAYDLGREKHVNEKLEEERRRLNIEIGMLKDPVRVVSFARDKLKMGPPAPGDVVRLAPGVVLGAPAAEPIEAKPVKRAGKAVRRPAPAAEPEEAPFAPDAAKAREVTAAEASPARTSEAESSAKAGEAPSAGEDTP
jgi:cell division protein FtsL